LFLIDHLILFGSGLLLIGILSSKFSARLGLPVLVLFLVLGMLAGEEGIGGIEFEDFAIAHAIGTLALAIILFDGGLRTPLRSVRGAWKPALVLSTLGVAVTAAVTGIAATWILGLSLLEGLLLGSIVASTDAAAVFSILGSKGLHLSRRLAATLEVESGSNDPMAVLLTIGIIELLLGRNGPGWGLAFFLVVQIGLGFLVGLLVGRLGSALINRIELDAAGLYPVLTAVIGLIAFGLSAALGGSGFLSVYIAGIVLGNSRLVFQRGTLLLHDGFAWISQMVMFIMLGLLSFPSQVLAVAPEGLLVAAVLILLARPLMIVVTMLPFRFSARELAFLSWAGLKGAVPIILATYPLIFGVPEGMLMFNLVFFVVLVSAVSQGWSLRLAADLLGVQGPPRPEAPVALEISSVRHIDGDIVDYTISPRSRAAERRLRDLALPEGAVVALIARDTTIIPPRGSTSILPGDHVFVVMRPGSRVLVDRVFGSRDEERSVLDWPAEFPLHGSKTLTTREGGMLVTEREDGRRWVAEAGTYYELWERGGTRQSLGGHSKLGVGLGGARAETPIY
jgi:potassium/hydrogen antiporter